MGKVRMSITIDEDVLKAVQHLAKEDSRNTSQMINKMLRDNLEKLSPRSVDFDVLSLAEPRGVLLGQK